MMGKFFTTAACCMMLLLVASSARAERPEAPSDLTVTINYDDSNGNYSAVFRWKAPRGANGIRGRVNGYRLYARDLGAEGSEFTEVGSSTETSVTLTDEVNICCTAYTFYVKAHNEEGESDESNRVSSVCGRDYNDGDFSDYDGSGESEIVSNPPQKAQLGKEYEYDPMVLNDIRNSGGQVSFSLVKGPSGMTIDESTGLVSWIPTEPGLYNVQITATLEGTTQVHDQIWTVQVASGVSGVPAVGAASISLYPNPAVNALTIRLLPSVSATELRVSNALGQKVLDASARAGQESVRLDVSSLGAGAYFVHIKSASEERVIPFNVVR